MSGIIVLLEELRAKVGSISALLPLEADSNLVFNFLFSSSDTSGENIAESLVAEGLATRREGMRAIK